jgi:hypothetical protein
VIGTAEKVQAAGNGTRPLYLDSLPSGPVAAWKLTVRRGSDVGHESFDDLDTAVAEMRRRALGIRAEGPVKGVSTLRDFGPEDQVHARLQLSGKGLLRKAVAGIDVRGNGEFVPYRGGVRREELDPTRHETPFDAVREALSR